MRSWRVVLAVVGLILMLSSICLLATSRLQIRRVRDREVVPIEAPPRAPTPESFHFDLGMI